MRGRWKPAILLLAVGCPAILLAAASARIGIAERLGATLELPALREAVRLNPADPNLSFRLGMLDTYSLGGSEGVQHLERAAQLSPRATRYWEAVASAAELVGNGKLASQAFAKALVLSPRVPRIHWEAANYDLRANRRSLGLIEFRRLLQMDPGYGPATFHLCCDRARSPQTIERELLGPASSPQLKLALIHFLTAHGHGQYAFHVWQEVASSQARFNFSTVDPYLEYLIAHGRARRAAVVWRDLARRGVVKQPADRNPGDLVFNGAFERFPLNAGLGWRYHAEPYLEMDFTAPGMSAETHSLRLDFTVSRNQEYAPVEQLVPVELNQTYLLTAYVRSRGITSANGPRLRVVDPACPACLNVASTDTTGTTSWHKVALNFSTGPETHFVRLSVWRPRSRTFPEGITGSFWLAAVTLEPASPAAN